MLAAGAPEHVAILSAASPEVRSVSLAKIRTLTGTVRPLLATNVAPVDATGSPQMADQVTGGTYLTVTLNDVEPSLPLASRDVHVIVVVPTGKKPPESIGPHEVVGCGSTASTTFGLP